jgi:hypothetical protein
LEDLNLECEDCGKESEDVSHHNFQEIKDSHWKTVVEEEDANLCLQCVDKRNADRSATYEKALAEQAEKPQSAASNPTNVDFSQLLTALKNAKADPEERGES